RRRLGRRPRLPPPGPRREGGRSRPGARRLLLEEVVEPATNVAGARRVRGSVALNCHAERERSAVVARVLVGHALGDGLRALKAPARVEGRALSACPNGRPAIPALLERRSGERQHRAAGPASGDGVPGEHPSARGSRGARWLRSLRLRTLATVALLAVFAVAQGVAPTLTLAQDP